MDQAKDILVKAWEENQFANHAILEAMSDLDDDSAGFDPRVTMTKAIDHQVKSANLVNRAKTMTKNPE
jgi:hypothetical protein